MVELKNKISNAFKYSNNLKNLVLIRDSVLDFELSLNSNSNNSAFSFYNSSMPWEKICNSLFGQKIEIWSYLISPFYYSQSKVGILLILEIKGINFY